MREKKNSTNVNRKIDIRGDGGIVVAPPSVNSDLGAAYEIIKGSFDNIDKLTKAKLYSLNRTDIGKDPSNIILEGHRNKSLFDYLRTIVQQKLSYDELLVSAEEFNNDKCYPPLHCDEVRKTAASVWEYMCQGKLITSEKPGTVIHDFEFEILKDDPKALALYVYIKRYNKGFRKVFEINQNAVAERLNWGKDSRPVRAAINTLIKKKIIKLVKAPRARQSHQYAFL